MMSKLRSISPGWYSAIAGAAAAGAVLVPGSRVVAGVAAGGAVLLLALANTSSSSAKGACCASCAGGDDHADKMPAPPILVPDAPPAGAPAPSTWADWFRGAGQVQLVAGCAL